MNGLMETLGNSNCSSDIEDFLGRDCGCGAQVSRHSHAFQHGCNADEACYICDGEFVVAFGHRRSFSLCNGGLQEDDVLFFVVGDEFQISEEDFVEAGFDEVVFGKCGKCFFVECVFKMLELYR